MRACRTASTIEEIGPDLPAFLDSIARHAVHFERSGLAEQRRQLLLGLQLVQHVRHTLFERRDGLDALVLAEIAIDLEEKKLLARVGSALLETASERIDRLKAFGVVPFEEVTHDQTNPKIFATGELVHQLLVAFPINCKIAGLGRQCRQV